MDVYFLAAGKNVCLVTSDGHILLADSEKQKRPDYFRLRTVLDVTVKKNIYHNFERMIVFICFIIDIG